MAKIIVNEPADIDGFRVVQDGFEMMKALVTGETIMHWELGNSMFPILQNAEYCKIRPIKDPHEVNAGDAVFCSFNGGYFMVHRCLEKYERDGEVWFKIGTTGGTVYGWTNEVYGIAESTNVFQAMTAEIMAATQSEDKKETTD